MLAFALIAFLLYSALRHWVVISIPSLSVNCNLQLCQILSLANPVQLIAQIHSLIGILGMWPEDWQSKNLKITTNPRMNFDLRRLFLESKRWSLKETSITQNLAWHNNVMRYCCMYMAIPRP
jgi:hypothetical protein